MTTRQQKRQAERQAKKKPSKFPEQKLAKNVNKGLCPELQEKTNTLHWYKNNKKGEIKKRNDGTRSAIVGSSPAKKVSA